MYRDPKLPLPDIELCVVAPWTSSASGASEQEGRAGTWKAIKWLAVGSVRSSGRTACWQVAAFSSSHVYYIASTVLLPTCLVLLESQAVFVHSLLHSPSLSQSYDCSRPLVFLHSGTSSCRWSIWCSSHSSLPWRLPPLPPMEQQSLPALPKHQSRTALLQAISLRQGSSSRARRLHLLMEGIRSSVSSRRTVSNHDSPFSFIVCADGF